MCVRLLPRKAEHLVLPGPFRWQLGEASNAHAMREPAIDGGCSELATDNRLRSSSPPSPTTQSPSNRDFPVLYEKPPIGENSCAHFVSTGCRLDFRGRFGAFVSALQFRTAEAGVGGVASTHTRAAKASGLMGPHPDPHRGAVSTAP